jgi:protein-glutamine gamma-glutamyltransferase
VSGLTAPAPGLGPRVPAARVAAPAAATRRGAPWLHLAAFAALAGFGSAYWASFVVHAPAGRVVGVLAVACALGAVLIVLGRTSLPRPAVHAAALLATLVALGLALVTIGLDAGLLKPARWDDLGALLDRGFEGLRRVSWPYGGPDGFVRLTVLLAVPPVLVLSAALAFWPVRRRPGFDTVALVLLVAFYAVAITDQKFGGDIGRGLVLLALIAAWLWLPHLGRRGAPAAAAALAAAGLFAMPVAAALDADQGWVDYSDWGIGREHKSSAAFDWNHRYGPIDWPRTGRTLLAVRSDEPHYWKAETLDVFDGLRWSHSNAGERRPLSAELPPDLNPAWEKKITVTVRELRSNVLIGAGTFFDSDGDIGVTVVSGDGTVRLIDKPLEEGDSYTVRAYVPDPTADRMRQAPDAWDESLRTYVAFALPRRGEDALKLAPGELRQRPIADRDRVALPFRGEPAGDSYTRQTVRDIRESPYARMFALSQRLARGQPTTYDVVRTTERWLQDNLRYSERVPSRPYPLSDFIFKDKVGYCQQFSGAMALMLRMNGIPARVAGGFAPGIYDQTTKEFRVRDLDAHSWVEVYFADVGWVPFDPTPTAAPAGSQSSGSSDASAARGGQDRTSAAQSDRAESRAGGGGPDSLSGDDGSSTKLWALPIVVLIVLALAIAGLWVYSLLHERRHRRATAADAQLAELRSALERMGHEVPPETTLSTLERRLGRLVGPGAARYAASLNARRYGPVDSPGPGRADRAALRRELAAAGGRLGRLRAFLALPPRPPA